MLTLVIATLAIIVASGFCSGIEAALFSVPIGKARQLAGQNKAGAQALLKIRENMNRPIAAVVILTNISNIVGSMGIGILATHALGSQWMGAFSAVFTLLIIMFSEIIPKTLGERHSDRIALLIAPPLMVTTKLLTPLIWLIERVTGPLTKGNKAVLTTNESEIRILAKIGHEEGAIEKDESTLIQRVFELNDTTALDLMTPRVAMTTLKGGDTLENAKTAIVESVHSRIIVVGESMDEVLGVVFKDELLTALVHGKNETLVKDWQQEVHLVTENTPADDLLTLFQKSRHHLAVVIDPYAAVRGVVSLEDVLEILTGEIVDETDLAADLQEVGKARLKSMGVEET